jgi:ribosomal protein S18 acetylase RimI-like enzyme
LGGIQPLKLSEVDIASGILARSFFNDPGVVEILPEVSDRIRLGKTLASSMIRFTLSCGIAVIDRDHHGVALWFPPESTAPTQDVLRQSGMLDVPSLVGDVAWSKIRGLMTELDSLHGMRAKELHWYLSMIGVDPEFQRRGIGDALLRSTLELADAQEIPCYLLTPSSDLIGFYGRRGFTVVADAHVLGGQLHMRLMRREGGRRPKSAL